MTETPGPRRLHADIRDELWIELRQAHFEAYHCSRSLDTPAARNRMVKAHGYRDGLLTAYAILTGVDDETIYEDLQDRLGD